MVAIIPHDEFLKPQTILFLAQVDKQVGERKTRRVNIGVNVVIVAFDGAIASEHAHDVRVNVSRVTDDDGFGLGRVVVDERGG